MSLEEKLYFLRSKAPKMAKNYIIIDGLLRLKSTKILLVGKFIGCLLKCHKHDQKKSAKTWLKIEVGENLWRS
jgi:hypothetical protein